MAGDRDGFPSRPLLAQNGLVGLALGPITMVGVPASAFGLAFRQTETLVRGGRTEENHPALVFRISLSLPLAGKFGKVAIPLPFAVCLHVDRTV